MWLSHKRPAEPQRLWELPPWHAIVGSATGQCHAGPPQKIYDSTKRSLPKDLCRQGDDDVGPQDRQGGQNGKRHSDGRQSKQGPGRLSLGQWIHNFPADANEKRCQLDNIEGGGHARECAPGTAMLESEVEYATS